MSDDIMVGMIRDQLENNQKCRNGCVFQSSFTVLSKKFCSLRSLLFLPLFLPLFHLFQCFSVSPVSFFFFSPVWFASLFLCSFLSLSPHWVAISSSTFGVCASQLRFVNALGEGGAERGNLVPRSYVDHLPILSLRVYLFDDNFTPRGSHHIFTQPCLENGNLIATLVVKRRNDRRLFDPCRVKSVSFVYTRK